MKLPAPVWHRWRNVKFRFAKLQLRNVALGGGMALVDGLRLTGRPTTGRGWS